MVTSTLELSGKLEAPHGVGPRVIAGQLVIGPISEPVRPKDLGLRTIHELHLINMAGTLSYVSVVAPGSYGNYASVTFVRLAYTSGKVGSVTLTNITSGSKTFRFSAVGE